MSDHDEASMESQALCDKLYECLSRRITNLNRVDTIRWCGIYQEGKNRFAYVNHRKRMTRIEVWCLGNPAELQRNTNLDVKPRQPTTGGFGALFQARFFVSNLSEVSSACELLRRISYKLS